SIRFNFLNDSTITGIKSVDSRYFHINILGCYNLKLNDLKITAHADSPNTEGIHIGSSNGSEISHSVIATGDDCVSLGHGISVGSLGKGINDEEVVGLTVRNCTFTGTNIVTNNVENPIVIDQLYCPYNKCNIKVPSQVKTSNVRFNNIRGTSANKIPCQNIGIGNINWVYNGVNVKVEGPETTSLCSNVKPTLFGKQIPATCV
ncbi:hypothetical protein CISIN_1g0424172mg, partial [Citrus sinensis]